MSDRRRYHRRKARTGREAERRKLDRRQVRRRNDERVPLGATAQVEIAGKRTFRRTVNLSLGGVGFDVPIPFRAGRKISMVLRLSGLRRTLRVGGRVVGDSGNRLGQRVHFIDLPPRARVTLEEYLRLFCEPTLIGRQPRGSAVREDRRVREGILIVKGDPKGRDLRLRSDDKTIGRDASSVDFAIDHYSVSRRHAHVYLHGCHHVITDLASTNGIHFKNKPYHTLTLKDGMVFHIGKVRVQYLVTRTVSPAKKADTAPGARANIACHHAGAG